MRVGIYTRGMDPITVIDLPPWVLEVGQRHSMVQVSLMDGIDFSKPLTQADAYIKVHTVTLEFLPLRMPGCVKTWIIQTRDDDLALLLTPSCLPGQQRMVNDYEDHINRLQSALINAMKRLLDGEGTCAPGKNRSNSRQFM